MIRKDSKKREEKNEVESTLTASITLLEMTDAMKTTMAFLFLSYAAANVMRVVCLMA